MYVVFRHVIKLIIIYLIKVAIQYFLHDVVFNSTKCIKVSIKAYVQKLHCYQMFMVYNNEYCYLIISFRPSIDYSLNSMLLKNKTIYTFVSIVLFLLDL